MWRETLQNKLYIKLTELVSFLQILVSLYSASSVSLCSPFLLSVSASVSLQFPNHVSHSLLTCSCTCQHSQLLPQPAFYPFHHTYSRFSALWPSLLEICWHSDSTLGLFIDPAVSEHGALTRAILNTTGSNGSWKAYSLEHAIMKSHLQVWSQGQYSFYESWVWHPVLNNIQIHPAQIYLVSSTITLVSSSRQIVTITSPLVWPTIMSPIRN